MKTKNLLKNISYFLSFLAVLQTSSFAMGAKKPAPSKPIPPTEVDSPPVSSPTPPTSGGIGDQLPIDSYKEVGSQVGYNVDRIANLNELSKLRSLINDDQIDSCMPEKFDSEQFSESISFFVQEMLENTPSRVSYISSYYGLSNNEASYFPTSLIRHPLCLVSKSSLSTTLGKNVPSEGVILKINSFVSRMNDLRQKTIQGDAESKVELQKEWSTWFSCLGYVESLSTADTPKSLAVANKYAPENYRKPAGVKFYEDPYQSEASRLNIGLFQFTPDSSGNIQSCLRAWNTMYPNCAVNLKGNRSEMIKTLGSSLQAFNAFCGVHKLIQTFSIQINTSKSSATHPSNYANGSLKKPENRCVSPHFAAGKAYNHFGPFQNSTGTNLSELLSCLERSR